MNKAIRLKSKGVKYRIDDRYFGVERLSRFIEPSRRLSQKKKKKKKKKKIPYSPIYHKIEIRTSSKIASKK